MTPGKYLFVSQVHVPETLKNKIYKMNTTNTTNQFKKFTHPESTQDDEISTISAGHVSSIFRKPSKIQQNFAHRTFIENRPEFTKQTRPCPTNFKQNVLRSIHPSCPNGKIHEKNVRILR